MDGDRDILEYSLFENQILEWQNKFIEYTFQLVKIPLKSNQYDNNLLLVHKKKINDNLFKFQF